MALWCYLIDGWSIDRLKVNPSLSGVEKECGLLAAAKDIYKRGIWWNRVPQPTITVTADKDSAYPVTIDGCDRRERRDRFDCTGAGCIYRGGDHRTEWLSDGR